MPVAIQTHGLSRSFGNLKALEGLDLEVDRGTVFGFLGPNGSGKTTTIRLLMGLLKPTSGTAEVLGLDPIRKGAEVRTRCGALLEFPGLYERMSAYDNLEFAARVARIPRGERQGRIKELLDRVGLWDRRREPAGAWSRGMKQKLAVARALVGRPELVFLDEPTAGLDAVAASQLRDELDHLVRQEGVTVFLTTHNLTEAERLCQKVAIIREGHLLALGTPAEIRARGRRGDQVVIVGRGLNGLALRAVAGVTAVSGGSERLEVTLAPGTDTAPLVAAVLKAKGAITEMRRDEGSLEETFLKLVEGTP
ncbi:MAG: ABC transporter ATP-binding protein [Thermoplasmatota archaeon]